SGQLFLWDLRANALAHGSISRRTNKGGRARLPQASLARNKRRSERQLAMRRAGGARSHTR
ncbi:hypothetical protein, partial [Pseudomonas putida]|uniref:hypothetical protein n=1 Tax=Pseudomonas putida TaxID=303 RepID=UPI00300F5250